MTSTGSNESEIQVLPSMYNVYADYFRQLPSDSSCEYYYVYLNSTGDIFIVYLYAVCSRSRGAPKLIDCNLGPENGISRNSSQQFYILKNNNFVFNHTWLEFKFDEEFEVKAVEIHYVCISTDGDPQMKVDIKLQYRERNNSMFTDFSKAPDTQQHVECRNTSDLNKLRIEVPDINQQQDIECDEKIAINIQFISQTEIKFHLSEVQFFKKANHGKIVKSLSLDYVSVSPFFLQSQLGK